MQSSGPAKTVKTVQSALAILIPFTESTSELFHATQAIRKQHDRHFYRWPPHINLLYPFIPHEDFEAAVDPLSELLRNIDPFTIDFTSIGSFIRPRKFGVWLSPQTREDETVDGKCPLMNLQDQLKNIFPKCNDLNAFEGGFSPHLTIGQFKKRKLYEAFIQQQAWTPRPLPVSEVCLIFRRGKQDHFHIAYRIQLGSGNVITHEPSPELAFLGYESTQESYGHASYGEEDAKSAQEEKKDERIASLLQSENVDCFSIDGSLLEGGGQVIRTSLALSAILNQPVHIDHIRGNRSSPGLKSQHLTGVQAIAFVNGGRLEGDTLRSSSLLFVPRAIEDVPGEQEGGKEEEEEVDTGRLTFDIGTAGAATLVLQALLPVLLFHPRHLLSRSVLLKGGTDVNWSPSVDHLNYILFPILSRHMGLPLTLNIHKRGFYPKGQGEVLLSLQGDPRSTTLEPLVLDSVERGVPSAITLCLSAGGANELVTEGTVDLIARQIESTLKRLFPSLVSGETTFCMLLDTRKITKVQYKGKKRGNDEEEHEGGSQEMKIGNRRVEGEKKSGRRSRYQNAQISFLIAIEGTDPTNPYYLSCNQLLEFSWRYNREAKSPSMVAQKVREAVERQVTDNWYAGGNVDEHTMDQLIVFMALAQGSSSVIVRRKDILRSLHLETCLHYTSLFTKVEFSEEEVVMQIPSLGGDGGEYGSEMREVTCVKISCEGNALPLFQGR